jgi:hypothetical protein
LEHALWLVQLFELTAGFCGWFVLRKTEVWGDVGLETHWWHQSLDQIDGRGGVRIRLWRQV